MGASPSLKSDILNERHFYMLEQNFKVATFTVAASVELLEIV
jgi:hypothetical protein